MTSDTTTDLVYPANMVLSPGAMQNWSDLDHRPSGSSAAVTELVTSSVPAGRRVLVAGPHSLDLVRRLAADADRLTLLTRSIPDAIAYGQTLLGEKQAEVLCGDLTALGDRRFDVLVAADDLSRVLSLEPEPRTWREVAEPLLAALEPSALVILGVENELSAGRRVAGRDPYAAASDADWSPTATFDVTRPSGVGAMTSLLGQLGVGQVVAGYGQWPSPDLVAAVPPAGALGDLLDALVLRDDVSAGLPGWVVRTAVRTRRLPEVAAGWWVVATRGQADPVAPIGVIAGTAPDRPITYNVDDAGAVLQRVGGQQLRLPEPVGAELLSERLLAACAAGDLPALRRLLTGYVDEFGAADHAYVSAGRLDDVLVWPTGSYALLRPGGPQDEVVNVVGAALVDLIRRIRTGSVRHPWPATIDDASLLKVLAAMAEAGLPDELDDLLAPATDAQRDPATDAADAAMIAALEQRVHDLESRAAWFEQRLDQREREKQQLQDQLTSAQQTAGTGGTQIKAKDAQIAQLRRQADQHRKDAAAVRGSMTFKAGKAVLTPARSAKRALKKFRG